MLLTWKRGFTFVLYAARNIKPNVDIIDTSEMFMVYFGVGHEEEREKMNGAYAYLRVSGAGQVNGHGLPRQREAIADYAKAHGYEIAKVFSDEGVSGTLLDRPGFADLVLAVQSNGVRVVIIERLDRLARDIMVQESIIRDLKAKGVNLISTTEGPDLAADDPTRKLIRQLFGAVAEYEKDMLVIKLRASRQAAKRKNGKCEGKKPYGDSDQKEIAAVKRIKIIRHKRKGVPKPGPSKVARILQAEGWPTRDGGPWRHQIVANIIKRLERRGRPKKVGI